MDDRSLIVLTIKETAAVHATPRLCWPCLSLASTNSMKFEYTAAFQQLSTELVMRESVAAPRIPKGSLEGGI